MSTRRRAIVTLMIALSLSYGVAHVYITIIAVRHVDFRINMQQLVLDREAVMPNQFHMYLVANVSHWLQDHGLTPATSFNIIALLGYAAVFVSLWALLSILYRRIASVLLGLFALAAYALLLFPWSHAHPADQFGAAVIALTLLAAVRGSIAGLALTSVAGGFLWSKQILMAPVILLYEGLQSRWWRGVALAVVVGALSFVGQLVYDLPDNPTVPGGALSPSEWMATLPRALKAHVAFALPPLLSLLLLRSRLHPIVKAAAATYPLMIGIYAVHGFFLYELRSFWPVVPAFVCLIAAWGDVDDAPDPEDSAEAAADDDGERPGPLDE